MEKAWPVLADISYPGYRLLASQREPSRRGGTKKGAGARARANGEKKGVLRKGGVYRGALLLFRVI